MEAEFAEFDAWLLDNRVTYEDANEVLLILRLARDTEYSQSSEFRSDTPEKPLLYHFPYCIPSAPVKTPNPAYKKSPYPFSIPRMALNIIFHTIEEAALKHYMKNTPEDDPEMAKLIVSKIRSAKRRVLGQVREATRGQRHSGKKERTFEDPRVQPRLCAIVGSEAIKAVQEAYEEIGRRTGIIALDNGEGKQLSLPAFSFDYPGTQMSHASSTRFPCLCKESFANEVCTAVLSTAKTGLQRTGTKHVDTARWEALDQQCRRNLNTVVPEVMAQALSEIAEPEDEDRCCGWNERTHVDDKMKIHLWETALHAVEILRTYHVCLQAETFGLELEISASERSIFPHPQAKLP